MRIRPLMLSALLLAGCGAPENEPASPPEPRANVFEPLTSTLERAEGVQATVDEQAAELRRRVEEAER